MLSQPSSAFLSSRLCRSLCSLILFAVAGAACLSAQTPPPPAGTQSPDASSSSAATDVQTPQVLKQKDPFNRDVAISAFGQDTNQTTGNNVRNGTTSSGGGMVSFRQSPRWWAGYEVNYGYTKFTDTYFNNIYRVKHNSNEFSVAYLLKSPVYKGYHLFGTVGAGIMSLNPTEYGGQVEGLAGGTPATQTVPLFVYSIGVEKRITERFGVRIQYRADRYKDPNFKLPNLDTFKLRTSDEPAAGVYYRF